MLGVMLALAAGRTKVRYTNYRGETEDREIFPLSTWFGATEYHPEPQWLMRAVCAKKFELRDFAMRDMVPLE